MDPVCPNGRRGLLFQARFQEVDEALHLGGPEKSLRVAFYRALIRLESVEFGMPRDSDVH
jgi:hypothetical protein